jgi:hypothetical protein
MTNICILRQNLQPYTKHIYFNQILQDINFFNSAAEITTIKYVLMK